MNTRNNRRRRESVERIREAFISLLQDEDLNEITVAELCKQCGLNRSTFYANFVDIYDLADKIREHLEKEINGLYGVEHVEEIVAEEDGFLRLFHHIKEHQSLYHTYFKLGYDQRQQFMLYSERLSVLARQHFGDQNVEYHIEFFKGGFNAVIKKWLSNGCRESPEEMVRIINSEYRGR